MSRSGAWGSVIAVGLAGLPSMVSAESRIATTATRLTEFISWEAWYAVVVGLSLIVVPAVVVVRLRRAGVARDLALTSSLTAGMLAALVGAGILEFIFLGSLGYMNLSPWPLLGAWAASALLFGWAGVRLGLRVSRRRRAGHR